MNYFLKENVNFMIFEMEFNSKMFRTKGEYFKLFISEKKKKSIKIANRLIFHAFQAVLLKQRVRLYSPFVVDGPIILAMS